MTAPKNDKARKAWLAGLKDGDEVANVSDEGRVLGIGPILRQKNTPCFLFGSEAGRRQRFTVTRGRAHPAYWNAEGWLVPVTPELTERRMKDALAGAACIELGKMNEHQWRQLSTDKILAVSAILWPEVKT